MTGGGRLDGRAVIITGAAQGIGAVFAEAVAAEGARVCLCDVVPPDAAVARITEAGGTAIGQVCDVTDPAAVATMVAKVVEQFGTVDGLVNNAALFASLRPRPLDQIDSAEFDRVMAVNVRGPFECIKAVLPAMRRQGHGKIVNIASGTVFKGTPMMLHYVSSKGAVVALTRSVARELGRDGIRANCIAPGLTMSEGVMAGAGASPALMQATVQSRCIPRDQMPTDLTGTLIFLLSPESDFMTGQTLVVDGGSIMN